MRIAILGTGAVGAYFGGRLSQAGRDVVFIARGKTLEALADRGLLVESTLGDVRLEAVEATDDLSVLRSADLVLVAVKSHQLPATAHAMAEELADHSLVVPLQNGIRSYETLSSALGPERVLCGLCRILSSVVAPGHVRHVGPDPTVLCGEEDQSRSPRIQTVIKALDGVPGMTLKIPGDIRRAIWQKFIFVGAFGLVGAAARFPAGVLRVVPETRGLLEVTMREIVAVGRAEGVSLPEGTEANGMAEIDVLPAAATASMQRDLMGGRPSELAGQFLPLFELARVHDILTPAIGTLYAALLPSELESRNELAGDR